MNWDTSWDTPKVTEAKPTNPWDAKSQDEVLMHWQSLKNQLAALKEDELEFRKYVVGRAFPNKEEGTNTLDLGNGYALKAAVKYNYKLADNDTVEKCLDEISKIGNQGPFMAERLVSWTPSFLLTEYRSLQEEAGKGSKEAIDILNKVNTMLTISEAAPTVTITEPKAKKK